MWSAAGLDGLALGVVVVVVVVVRPSLLGLVSVEGEGSLLDPTDFGGFGALNERPPPALLEKNE